MPRNNQSAEVGCDNGTVGGVSTDTKKYSSNKKILKELVEALERNNTLREQVAQLTAENNWSAGCPLVQAGTDVIVTKDESLLLSTTNNWTLGTLNISECVPSEGQTEIDERAFEY